MHGLAVFQRNYSQVLFDLRDDHPVAYPAIGLHLSSYGAQYSAFAPLTSDVRTLTEDLLLEVPR